MSVLGTSVHSEEMPDEEIEAKLATLAAGHNSATVKSHTDYISRVIDKTSLIVGYSEKDKEDEVGSVSGKSVLNVFKLGKLVN